MKRWTCSRMPGVVLSGPGHVACPRCRPVPAEETAATLAEEFVSTWHALGFGVPPISDVVEAVFVDLLEREVIE